MNEKAYPYIFIIIILGMMFTLWVTRAATTGFFATFPNPFRPPIPPTL